MAKDGGFSIVPRSVLEIMPKIGGNGLAVYVCLVGHANADFKCWPSKKRISKLTGVSLRAVRIQLIALEAIGVIAIESRMDGSRHETNLYKILPPYRPPKRVVQNLHEVAHEMHEGGAENDPRVVQEMHPNKSKRTRVKELKGANASVLNFDEVSIPEVLDSKSFREAWSEWVAHKKEIKSQMTPRAAKMALKKISAWGPDRAVKAIEHSIAQTYKGIYEEKQNGKKSSEPEQEIVYSDINRK